MNKEKLFSLIKEIVIKSKILKDKYTSEKDARVNYVCIFAQNISEYEELVLLTSTFGEVVKDTSMGPIFKIPTIKTVSGDLKLLKIRKPEIDHKELGDADFTIINYTKFKNKYLINKHFMLITRLDFEMIELMKRGYDVRVYFSNPPLDQELGIR